jgi:hypothetical protein
LTSACPASNNAPLRNITPLDGELQQDHKAEGRGPNCNVVDIALNRKPTRPPCRSALSEIPALECQASKIQVCSTCARGAGSASLPLQSRNVQDGSSPIGRPRKTPKPAHLPSSPPSRGLAGLRCDGDRPLNGWRRLATHEGVKGEGFPGRRFLSPDGGRRGPSIGARKKSAASTAQNSPPSLRPSTSSAWARRCCLPRWLFPATSPRLQHCGRNLTANRIAKNKARTGAF